MATREILEMAPLPFTWTGADGRQLRGHVVAMVVEDVEEAIDAGGWLGPGTVEWN